MKIQAYQPTTARSQSTVKSHKEANSSPTTAPVKQSKLPTPPHFVRSGHEQNLTPGEKEQEQRIRLTVQIAEDAISKYMLDAAAKGKLPDQQQGTNPGSRN